MTYGKNAKVYPFPKTTRRRIVCQYSSVTTTEPSPSLKVNDKIYWPTILGLVIGIVYVSILFLL